MTNLSASHSNLSMPSVILFREYLSKLDEDKELLSSIDSKILEALQILPDLNKVRMVELKDTIKGKFMKCNAKNTPTPLVKKMKRPDQAAVFIIPELKIKNRKKIKLRHKFINKSA